MTYAKGTKVKAEKSRGEIERTLERYNATGFMYGWNETGAVIGFTIGNRQYRTTLKMPDKESFNKSGRGKRTPAQAKLKYEEATRARWRAMNLVILAKLEAAESEISTVEKEFFGWTVLPSGRTVEEELLPKLEVMYETGQVPQLLRLTGGEIMDAETEDVL